MLHYTQYLKDTLGSNFLGVKIFEPQIEPYMDRLKKILGEEFEKYKENKLVADKGEYFIEVISVFEYDNLVREKGMDEFINSLDSVFSYEIDDIRFLGLGRVQLNSNTSYFIIINSDKLSDIRQKYDLPVTDFHVTIGFKWKDVKGVRKNQILPEKSNFIKLLSDEFYKHDETFEFIKNIDNFTGDSELEINPIKIKETSATFRIGKNSYFTITLIDDKFRISAEWFGTSDLPILSTTVIKKKFKEL
jgi:hypothetical protein